MKNADFYISPYGKRNDNPNQLVCFAVSLLLGVIITALVLCVLALHLNVK